MNEKLLLLKASKSQSYWLAAQARTNRKIKLLAERKDRAWNLARRAAILLKGDYGVKRVVLIGSLASGKGFHPRSDIDLVIWGLDENKYYQAVGRLLGLDPEFEVDLIEAEYASPNLSRVIEQDGVSL
jgi:predicted nucleotidyltransferase